MLIDWFTVVAQVINFVVLVWLLRRFLYGPITRAMTERQRGIDQELAEAARIRREAETEGERLRREHERFEARRDELSRELREQVDEARRAQLAQVRAEVDELQARWRAAVVEERDGFLLELRQRTGQQIVDTVRRALRDLASSSLEAQVIDRFIDRLDALDDQQRRTLVEAGEANGHRLHVRTAFEVPDPHRQRLSAAIAERIGPGHDVRFEVVPTLLGGVELRAGGQALAWTFEEYLDQLEAALGEALAKG
jgi:F-type H+-transporting ATPase subunit b